MAAIFETLHQNLCMTAWQLFNSHQTCSIFRCLIILRTAFQVTYQRLPKLKLPLNLQTVMSLSRTFVPATTYLLVVREHHCRVDSASALRLPEQCYVIPGFWYLMKPPQRL